MTVHNEPVKADLELRPLTAKNGSQNGQHTELSTRSVEEAAADLETSPSAGSFVRPLPTAICDCDSIKAVILEGKLNILLLTAPFALLAKPQGWGDGIEFAASLIAICPLAERLGFITEELSKHTNSTIGGLLNATFGNATEVIVSLFAIRSGLLRVVQLSLLGSVLSNMLLVLGSAWFLGGLKHHDQSFNLEGIGQNFGLLMMAVASCCLPVALHYTNTELDGTVSELALSRFCSCLMLALYMAFIFFQLVSHVDLYEEDDPDAEDDEPPVLSFWGGVIWLAFITVLISVLSDTLVDSIKGAADSWGCSISFISTIMLPIVGNAAEHAGAVVFAVKNKMDMSLGVAVGSSTQIALFVLPLCVIIAWVCDKPLDLNLQVFETVTLFVTVVAVALACSDGKSNWLKGLALVLSYLVLSAGFFYHKDVSLATERHSE